MSNSDWSEDQLDGFDIHIAEETPAQFFGLLPDHPNNINPDLFRYAGAEVDDPQVQSILSYLYMIETQSTETIIDLFCLSLFKYLGFEKYNRAVVTRYSIPLLVAGKTSCRAETDADKPKRRGGRCIDAQLMARAIAACQINYNTRRNQGLPEMDVMVIPGVTMVGTRPTFFKIPVTKELCDAVARGNYPFHKTVVKRCSLSHAHAAFGLSNPEFRKFAIPYYLRLRDFVDEFADAILSP